MANAEASGNTAGRRAGQPVARKPGRRVGLGGSGLGMRTVCSGRVRVCSFFFDGRFLRREKLC